MPYFTSDHWTGELEGLWTETDTRTAADTAIDMDSVYGTDIRTKTNTNIEARTAGDTDIRIGDDLNMDNGGPRTSTQDMTPVILQEAAPKPREQIVSEVADKLRRPGLTPGRAMISAEQTYSDAVKRFGPKASTVLEMLQPGQDPRRFLDGFQNAYIAGKMRNSEALKNSGVAAYLTEWQKEMAFGIGVKQNTETRLFGEEKNVDNVRGNGIIKENGGDSIGKFVSRVSTGGNRNEKALTTEQIAQCIEYAGVLGMPKERIRYGEHYNTSYGSVFDMLYIGTDAYPVETGRNANQRLSYKAAIAHELIGHRETCIRGTNLDGVDVVLDEVQASIRAARFAPGLTVQERMDLLQDAMERLEKDGRSIDEVRHMLDIERR